MARYANDLDLAHALADSADTISMTRFRALDLKVESKPDLTPVSDADIAVERAIRVLLEENRPDDDVLGEEFGTGERPTTKGSRRWVIDPIDGTKNFVRGVPIWATLIALLEGNRPILGLVSAPALGRRWWAAAGQGAYAGTHPAEAIQIKVSGVGELPDASFCYSSLSGWEQIDRLDPMLDIMRQCWRSRAYGDFYGYMLVAEGAVDAMVEPELSLWDVAALIPIVTEAGGSFTDRAGNPANGSNGAVASNGKLHENLLGRLR